MKYVTEHFLRLANRFTCFIKITKCCLCAFMSSAFVAIAFKFEVLFKEKVVHVRKKYEEPTETRTRACARRMTSSSI